jgi:hypothetical protein
MMKLVQCLVLCSNSFLGLLLAEGLVLFFAFEAHGMMIRSVNPDLQLEQSTSVFVKPRFWVWPFKIA